jgi:zinc-ribbon domain
LGILWETNRGVHWGSLMFCMKCGLELPDDSRFCRKCGFAFPIAASQPSTTTTPVPESVSSATLSRVSVTSAPTKFTSGTWVFAGLSVVTLAFCFAKGIIPIYLVAAAVWAGLAWYWQTRGPFDEGTEGTVCVVAVLVAAAQFLLMAGVFGK